MPHASVHLMYFVVSRNHERKPCFSGMVQSPPVLESQARANRGNQLISTSARPHRTLAELFCLPLHLPPDGLSFQLQTTTTLQREASSSYMRWQNPERRGNSQERIEQIPGTVATQDATPESAQNFGDRRIHKICVCKDLRY